MENWLLETHSTNPYYNLSFEEYILLNKTIGNYLILWQNDNTIVIGQNQNTEAEINRRFVEEHGIHVVRRTTGGGAVFHDLGNINYSFITDYLSPEHSSFSELSTPIVMALKKLGLNAKVSGRNDIEIDGKKVSGTAQRIIGKRILHHGTLLFDSDLSVISQALNGSPEKYTSKGISSVRSRIDNIKNFLDPSITFHDFWDYLVSELTADKYNNYYLDNSEIMQIVNMEKEKYSSWEWNYGHSPYYSFNNKERWAGGTLSISINVQNGMINGIAFHGDFMSVCPLDPLVAKLVGIQYKYDDVKTILDSIDISPFFGSITEEEVLRTIFPS